MKSIISAILLVSQLSMSASEGTTTTTTTTAASTTTTTTTTSGPLSAAALSIYNRLIANGVPHNEAHERAVSWRIPMSIPFYNPASDEGDEE